MTTIDLTKSRIAKSGNIISPKGRLSYAQYLLDPQERTYEDSGKTTKVYQGSLLVPPKYDFSELKKKMAKIALEKCDGDKKRAITFVEKRFLDPNNLPQGGKPAGEEFEGWTLIRATSSRKPNFAYPNGKEIDPKDVENELYSGRWACFSINPFWTANKKNPGVCLGLQNVHLLEHAENIGSKSPDVTDEFESAEEGGDSDEAGSSVSDADVDDMFGT